MYKGYYSSQKPTNEVYGTNAASAVAFPTVEPVRELQDALSVKAHAFLRVVETDTAEAQTTNYQIKATGTAAKRGDVIKVTAGTYSGREFPVINVQSDVIYIADDINIGAVAFTVLRHASPIVDSAGALSTTATLTPSPILFDRNGVDTEVKEDTGTPGDSRPLPVKILGTTGVAVDLATQTTLAALLTELQLKADLSETQPVSVAGVSTSANQATLITGVGSLTETAPADDTASSGLNGRLQRIAQRITSLIALVPASLGSKAAASSFAVTASTEDLARIGTVTETAPASDTASSGINGRLQRIAQRLTSLIALVPTALGTRSAATSFAVALSTEDVARVGIITETAPASDTASSGMNGRLQRIAQRLTSLIALIPASLGQKTMANSLAVVLASDQSSIPVASNGRSFITSARNDYSSVNVTSSAWVQLIASTGSAANGLTIFDSGGFAMELGIGAAASETRLLLIPPGGLNGAIPLAIPASSRISVRAVGTATVSAGELDLNLF